MHIRMQVRQTQHPIERKGVRTVHEGDRFATTDIHGNITLQPFERFQTELAIPADEYNSMSLSDVLDRVDQTTEELVRQKNRHIYRTLDEITESTGNVFDAGGNLTADKLIDGLSQIPWTFDRSGAHQFIIIVHPDNRRKLADLERQIDTTPRLTRKWQELIASKRREWNDREALRKLVG